MLAGGRTGGHTKNGGLNMTSLAKQFERQVPALQLAVSIFKICAACAYGELTQAHRHAEEHELENLNEGGHDACTQSRRSRRTRTYAQSDTRTRYTQIPDVMRIMRIASSAHDAARSALDALRRRMTMSRSRQCAQGITRRTRRLAAVRLGATSTAAYWPPSRSASSAIPTPPPVSRERTRRSDGGSFC